MSTNVHYTQISEPQLLDIVDEAWLRDKLPDDSEYQPFMNYKQLARGICMMLMHMVPLLTDDAVCALVAQPASFAASCLTS